MAPTIIELHPQNPQPRRLRQVVELLQQGELIAYPTDTVYGLGCDLTNRGAIDRLYRISGKDPKQPLAMICVDLAEVSRYVVLDNPAYRLLRRILPGAYTCILPATREVPKSILPKRNEVGVRVPEAEIPKALARALARPLLNTTATGPDGEPLQWPEDIARRFPQLAAVIDGGPGGVVPTTVLDLTGPELLVVREGAGSVQQL